MHTKNVPYVACLQSVWSACYEALDEEFVGTIQQIDGWVKTNRPDLLSEHYKANRPDYKGRARVVYVPYVAG